MPGKKKSYCRKSWIVRANRGAENATESLAEKLAAGAATRVGELLREELPNASVARIADQEETSSSTSRIDMILRTKIEAGVRQLARGLVERETECRLLMLGALSGEHVLLVGPPGTAKSELGRRLSTICTGGVFFSRLLTRFSVPEELFGPLSMQALERDEYVRKTDKYLPQAEVAFVDEVFKANSAILNSLLTILNEKLFDNGTERVEVPLLLLVGASNELPESEELDALYDRFLIRREVRQVSEQGIKELLRQDVVLNSSEEGDGNQEQVAFSKEEFARVNRMAKKVVDVPDNVLYLLADLRRHLQEEVEPPVYISDRRLIKVVNMLRVAAYTNARDAVSEFDCLLLKHCLWNKPEEGAEIARWMNEKVTMMQLQGIEQVQYMLAGMFGRACRTLDKITMLSRVEDVAQGNDTSEATSVDPASIKEFESLVDEVVTIRTMVLRRLRESQDAEALSAAVIGDHLWLSEEDKTESLQMSAPNVIKAKKELNALLTEVVTLETALREQAEPVVLAELMPSYWSSFIRNGDIREIRKIGLAS